MKMIFSDFMAWLASSPFDVPYSAHTLRLYGKICADFDDFCIDESIEDCSEFSVPHVRKFVGFRRDDVAYAKSTVGVRSNVLSLIFTYLQEVNLCSENPVVYFREQKKKRFGGRGGRIAVRLPECLSWDEQERLLHVSMLDDTFAGYRDSALIALMFDTGLRTQETIDLPLSAGNDYFDGRLRVIGKGNKERLVRFTPTHADYVSAWLKKRHIRGFRLALEDRLFVTERGGIMRQQTIYHAVNKLLKLAKIDNKQQRGAHLLRHTAASIMLASGLSLKLVQENLGHSSILTTEKYLHLLDAPS